MCANHCQSHSWIDFIDCDDCSKIEWYDYFFNDLVANQVHEILGLDTTDGMTDKQALKVIKQHVTIKTKAQMVKLGIDPYNYENWYKQSN